MSLDTVEIQQPKSQAQMEGLVWRLIEQFSEKWRATMEQQSSLESELMYFSCFCGESAFKHQLSSLGNEKPWGAITLGLDVLLLKTSAVIWLSNGKSLHLLWYIIGSVSIPKGPCSTHISSSYWHLPVSPATDVQYFQLLPDLCSIMRSTYISYQSTWFQSHFDERFNLSWKFPASSLTSKSFPQIETFAHRLRVHSRWNCKNPT